MKKVWFLMAFLISVISVFAQPNIKVFNSDYKDYYIQGGTNAYTVTVYNAGSQAATNVKVSTGNSLPGGISSFRWSGGLNGGTMSSGVNKPLNDVISSMPAGAMAIYNIVLQVPSSYAIPLTSTVTVTSATTGAAQFSISDTDNKLDTNIVLTNTDGKVKYDQGGTNTYTLTVENKGPNAANNIDVKNDFTNGLTSVSWVRDDGKIGSGNLTDNLPNLPAGGSVKYVITVSVPGTFTGNIDSKASATIAGVSVKTNDTDVQGNLPQDPLVANITALKTNNKNTYLYNGENVYTIVVTNNGPNVAKNVVVTDVVPAGLEKTAMSWYGSNGASGTGDLSDVIPILAVGDVVVYTVVLKIPAVYELQDPSNPTGPTIKNLTNAVVLTSDTKFDPNCPGCKDIDGPAPNYVTIDTSKYNAQQLVNEVLITTPCVDISGFESSKNCGFGYFNKANSSFPIKEGMIIRCGDAKKTEGKWDDKNFNNNDVSTVCSNETDADLQAILVAQGESKAVKDASFVKFNFVAGSDNFSFRYLFAANEYGTYQCDYADAFAFILTDVATGQTQNLAVIPGTNVPVTVKSVRNDKYNGKCPSAHPEYFGQFNPNNPLSAIRMQGQTVVMKASGNVTPGKLYSIKMVIGDSGDTFYDSAVFIEAGSFDLGTPQVVGSDEFEGMSEISICPDVDSSNPVYIKSGSKKLPGVVYTWKRNGQVIVGANDYRLPITQAGVYTVIYTYPANGGCEQSDDMVVTTTGGNTYQEPNDLDICDYPGATFDLTVNEPVVLGGQDSHLYDIGYFTTIEAAKNGGSVGNLQTITDAEKRSYNGSKDNASHEIFMRIALGTQTCFEIKKFKLFRTSPPPDAKFKYGKQFYCSNESSSVQVIKENPFPEGGEYSVLPTTGLLVDQNTGALDLTAAKAGIYDVIYTPQAVGGCLPKLGKAQVVVSFCVEMDPVLDICSGEPLRLTCTNAGAGVAYGWYQDGTKIGETTEPNFDVPSPPVVAGNYVYSVVVKNDVAISEPSSRTMKVNPVPVATISGSASICQGKSAVVRFSGTPNAVVYYVKNGIQPELEISLGPTGVVELTESNLSADVTYQLLTAEIAGCSKDLSGTTPVKITAIGAPTATVSYSGGPVCEGQSVDVVFEGTPSAVISYAKNGETLSLTLNASGQPTIMSSGVLNGDTEFKILSVTSSGASCVGSGGSPIVVDVVNIPQTALKQKAYICQDPVSGATTRTCVLDTGLNSDVYDFVWRQGGNVILGATQSDYEAVAVGEYRVLVTDRTSGCTRTTIANVLASKPPTNVLPEVTTAYFEDNATVVVTATPVGDYEYSVDFGPFQESNVFEGVGYGDHKVRVRDKEACDVLTKPFKVINFPRYFSPNSDGYNDIWNISALEDQPNAKIYIFDRFGKLLKQIAPSGAGWDGTYNGQPMPADDYWFVVQYQEQLNNKEFKSHFSLKR